MKTRLELFQKVTISGKPYRVVSIKYGDGDVTYRMAEENSDLATLEVTQDRNGTMEAITEIKKSGANDSP